MRKFFFIILLVLNAAQAKESADIVVVLDSSSSIAYSKQAVNYAKRILFNPCFDQKKSFIALITFNESIETIFDFSNQKTDIFNHWNEDKILQGYTINQSYIGPAIEKAQEILNQSQNKAHKIIVVISDGGFSNEDEIKTLKSQLSKDEIGTVALSIPTYAFVKPRWMENKYNFNLEEEVKPSVNNIPQDYIINLQNISDVLLNNIDHLETLIFKKTMRCAGLKKA